MRISFIIIFVRILKTAPPFQPQLFSFKLSRWLEACCLFDFVVKYGLCTRKQAKRNRTKLVSSPNNFGYQCNCGALLFHCQSWPDQTRPGKARRRWPKSGAPPQKGLPVDNACHAPFGCCNGLSCSLLFATFRPRYILVSSMLPNNQLTQPTIFCRCV